MPRGVLGNDWKQVPPRIWKQLLAAVEKGGPIYLFGEPGRGKSCAAAAMHCWCQHDSQWWDAVDLIATLMRCRMSETGAVQVTDGEGVSKWVYPHSIEQRTSRPYFVVFDDIATKSLNDPQQEAFLNLVNLRAGKRTLYTSNCKWHELGTKFHQRIVSRILSGTIIEITGDDRRLRKA